MGLSGIAVALAHNACDAKRLINCEVRSRLWVLNVSQGDKNGRGVPLEREVTVERAHHSLDRFASGGGVQKVRRGVDDGRDALGIQARSPDHFVWRRSAVHNVPAQRPLHAVHVGVVHGQRVSAKVGDATASQRVASAVVPNGKALVLNHDASWEYVRPIEVFWNHTETMMASPGPAKTGACWPSQVTIWM